jgi:hypothetical protein
MTEEQFKKLTTGDIVRLESNHTPYVVTANHGESITAVKTMNMTNPHEWVLVLKANYSKPDK